MASVEEVYHRCVRSFAEEAYEDCASIGLSLLDYIYNVDFYHVLFNSLERLERKQEAHNVAIQGLNTFERVPWEQSLFKLSIGRTQLEDVAQIAADALQLSRAHYYAGSRLLTLGDVDAAVGILEACLYIAGNAQVDCLERQLAKAELSAIEQSLNTLAQPRVAQMRRGIRVSGLPRVREPGDTPRLANRISGPMSSAADQPASPRAAQRAR